VIDINVVADGFVAGGVAALVRVYGMLGYVLQIFLVEHDHLRRQREDGHPVEAAVAPETPSLRGGSAQPNEQQEGGNEGISTRLPGTKWRLMVHVPTRFMISNEVKLSFSRLKITPKPSV
jgi:hypothetical protein